MLAEPRFFQQERAPELECEGKKWLHFPLCSSFRAKALGPLEPYRTGTNGGAKLKPGRPEPGDSEQRSPKWQVETAVAE